jgi:hypothetical protein
MKILYQYMYDILLILSMIYFIFIIFINFIGLYMGYTLWYYIRNLNIINIII